MIYELRIYRCVPGRKPALLSRFENETLRIWEKHGIRQAGFWTTLIGKSSQEITYMLAWDSMAEREKRWGAFLADPACICETFQRSRKRAMATGSGPPWQGPETRGARARKAESRAITSGFRVHRGARHRAGHRPAPLAMPRNDEKRRRCAMPSDV